MKTLHWIIVVLVILCMSAVAATGIYRMFAYRPTLEYAYNDILALRDVSANETIRIAHYASAIGLTALLVVLLVANVVVTARKRPITKWRIVGHTCFVIAVMVAGGAWFTGDYVATVAEYKELAMWAATQGSNRSRATPFLGHEASAEDVLDSLRNSESPDPSGAQDNATMNRMYVFHCIVLPIVFCFLIVGSVWILRPKKTAANTQTPTQYAT